MEALKEACLLGFDGFWRSLPFLSTQVLSSIFKYSATLGLWISSSSCAWCRAVQSSQPPRILYFVISLALSQILGITDTLKAPLFSLPHLGLPRFITDLGSCSRFEVHHEVVKTLEVWYIVLVIWEEPGYVSGVDCCWEDTSSAGAYTRPWKFRKAVWSQE